MSQFTEHPIATLAQWNAVLAAGCCCEMPECPLVTKQCESIVAQGVLNGYVPDADPVIWDPKYAVTILTYSGASPAVVTFTANCIIFVTIGGVDFSIGNGDVTVVYSGGDDYDQPSTRTYDSPKSEADTISETFATASASLDFESETQYKGASCAASFSQPFASASGSNFTIALTYVRFRWVIPDTFAGSYFKRTWDIVEEPDGWNAEPPTAARTFFARNQSWVWDGPGDPAAPETWKSAWYALDPPTSRGTRRVVNIRDECYRGPFGTRPQVTGEIITDDDL